MSKGTSLVAPEEHRELFRRLGDTALMLDVFRRELPRRCDAPITVEECHIKVAKSRRTLQRGRLRLVYTIRATSDGVQREYRIVGTAPEGDDYYPPEFMKLCDAARDHPAVRPFTELAGHVPELRLAFHMFPVDMYLPALVEVTGPSATDVLAPHMPAVTDVVSYEVHAFRPAHRCVLRMHLKETGGPGRIVYLKILENPSRARRLKHLRPLWEAMGADAPLKMPEPLGFDDGRRLLIMAEAEGERSLTEWIGCLEKGTPLPDGVDLDRLHRCMELVARGLARLQQCGVELPTRRSVADTFTTMHEDLEWIGGMHDALAGEARSLVARLESELAADHALVPAHGAFNHKQMIGDDRDLTLIDWDDIAMAHPAADAADFLGRLLKEPMLAPGAFEEIARLGVTFRRAFIEHAGNLDERDLARLEALGLCEKALRAFRRPGDPERAARDIRCYLDAARSRLGPDVA